MASKGGKKKKKNLAKLKDKDTGHIYYTYINPKTTQEKGKKLELMKYSPVERKHKLYKQV